MSAIKRLKFKTGLIHNKNAERKKSKENIEINQRYFNKHTIGVCLVENRCRVQIMH